MFCAYILKFFENPIIKTRTPKNNFTRQNPSLSSQVIF